MSRYKNIKNNIFMKPIRCNTDRHGLTLILNIFNTQFALLMKT